MLSTPALRTTYTWLFASALTIGAWLFARGHVTARTAETVTVLAFAAVKARLILRNFMEVRSAPRWLRRFTDGWLVVLSATILAMYLG